VALGYVVVALVAAAVAVFALQNLDPVTVRFLGWFVPDLPVAAVVLLSLAAGMLLAGFPLWIQRWRCRARCRALEARLQATERPAGPTPPVKA
jgi:uncharacterized integral membrane protein